MPAALKVKELIDILEHYDPELPVAISHRKVVYYVEYVTEGYDLEGIRLSTSQINEKVYDLSDADKAVLIDVI